MAGEAGTTTETRSPAAEQRSLRGTFSSLRIRNYRVYFYGQSVSLVGTWMQMTAQAWLVLTLTHSAPTAASSPTAPTSSG
jgi:hypothetical protein